MPTPIGMNLEEWAAAEGWVAARSVDDVVVAIVRQTFGKFRLVVNCDYSGYQHGY